MSTQGKTPQAFIAINKGRQKIHPSNKIYLKDQEEFEVELFNPLQKNVLAKISLNGTELPSGLILKPGQRYFLDRFIDDPKKFKFDTYEVENSQEVKEAIAKNGLITIKFYEEKIKPQPICIPYYVQPLWTHISYPNNNIFVGTCQNQSNQQYGQGLALNNQSLGNNVLRSSNSTGTYNLNSAIGTTTTSYSAQNSTLTTSGLNQPTLDFMPLNETVETGRIEKGSQSNQSFDVNYDLNFNSYTVATYSYKLTPESNKPIEISDLVNKKFCSSCGSKIKKSWKFCTNCSQSLI